MEQTLKHDSPGDVSKRDEGGPIKRNGGLHPLYLIPGFLSGKRGLEAAGLNARWDHAAWIKHCKRGTAYRKGKEASSYSYSSFASSARRRSKPDSRRPMHGADRSLYSSLVHLISHPWATRSWQGCIVS